MMRLVSNSSAPTPITVYRGQKYWRSGQTLSAASSRRSWGSAEEMRVLTDRLLAGYEYYLGKAVLGDAASVHKLGDLMREAQILYYLNPFVSCSLNPAIGLAYATQEDTDGFLLTIEGAWEDGFDFEAVRKQFALQDYGLSVLEEFGIPGEVEAASSFSLVKVEAVTKGTLSVSTIYSR